MKNGLQAPVSGTGLVCGNLKSTNNARMRIVCTIIVQVAMGHLAGADGLSSQSCTKKPGTMPGLGEPLNKSMIALAYSRICYQDALLQTCVDLSKKCNAESGFGCMPLWARPVAHHCGVVALAKGYGHYLRTTPCSSVRQTRAE